MQFSRKLKNNRGKVRGVGKGCELIRHSYVGAGAKDSNERGGGGGPDALAVRGSISASNDRAIINCRPRRQT